MNYPERIPSPEEDERIALEKMGCGLCVGCTSRAGEYCNKFRNFCSFHVAECEEQIKTHSEERKVDYDDERERKQEEKRRKVRSRALYGVR